MASHIFQTLARTHHRGFCGLNAEATQFLWDAAIAADDLEMASALIATAESVSEALRAEWASLRHPVSHRVAYLSRADVSETELVDAAENDTRVTVTRFLADRHHTTSGRGMQLPDAAVTALLRSTDPQTLRKLLSFPGIVDSQDPELVEDAVRRYAATLDVDDPWTRRELEHLGELHSNGLPGIAAVLKADSDDAEPVTEMTDPLDDLDLSADPAELVHEIRAILDDVAVRARPDRARTATIHRAVDILASLPGDDSARDLYDETALLILAFTARRTADPEAVEIARTSSDTGVLDRLYVQAHSWHEGNDIRIALANNPALPGRLAAKLAATEPEAIFVHHADDPAIAAKTIMANHAVAEKTTTWDRVDVDAVLDELTADPHWMCDANYAAAFDAVGILDRYIDRVRVHGRHLSPTLAARVVERLAQITTGASAETYFASVAGDATITYGDVFADLTA